MSVGTCRNCGETIMTPSMETYYVHTRTGMAQCGIRYATPVNPTADETKDFDQWTRLDLDAFWEGLNGIEPIGAMSEPEVDEKLKSSDLETEVEHSEIRASAIADVMPTNVCPKCGEKL